MFFIKFSLYIYDVVDFNVSFKNISRPPSKCQIGVLKQDRLSCYDLKYGISVLPTAEFSKAALVIRPP